MDIKVVKFGGSSLADANQFKKVAQIIKSDSARKYAVPSAPGKRFPEDVKITDMFYKCHSLADCGDDFSGEFGIITQRYDSIISELGLSISLKDDYIRIEADLKAHAGRDYAASRGEYLNGKILAAYLNFEFIDAAEVLIFENSGKFSLEKSIKALRSRLSGIEYAVIPGFYGAMENGIIKTFSRGGSDVTGSIVARAVNASLYENWTDVSGFLIADPRVVENPKVIKTITYKELRELSYMGATVLHEEAIFPVRAVGIPINIKNTNSPEDSGTMIVADDDAEDLPAYTITGIAGTKGFASINIEKAMMNTEIGFGRRVLEVLERNGISFEHMPSGIDTMSIILNEASVHGRETEIISQLKKAVDADHIEIDKGLALLAVVGRGMRRTRGTAARIFAALAHARINVVMIDQGSSELNVIVGVSERDFEEAARKIYEMFVLSAE